MSGLTVMSGERCTKFTNGHLHWCLICDGKVMRTEPVRKGLRL